MPARSVMLKGAAFWLPVLALALIFPQLPVSGRSVHTGVLICIYGVTVYGLGFLFGTAGQLSVAHGTLWGVGGYTAALLTLNYGVSFWLCLPAAMVMAALFAGLVGYPSLRVKGHYFLIMTFAFSEIARVVALNWRTLTNGDTGLVLAASPDALGPITLNSRVEWYYFTLFLLVVAIIAAAILPRIPLGRRLKAAAQNEALATAAGVNAARDRVVAFMISGLFAGCAGACWAYYQHFMNPDQFGSGPGIEFILMLLIGGAQSLSGPIIGVIVTMLLPRVFGFSATQNEIALGVIFIAIILLMPKGVPASLGDLLRGRLRAKGRAA